MKLLAKLIIKDNPKARHQVWLEKWLFDLLKFKVCQSYEGKQLLAESNQDGDINGSS